MSFKIENKDGYVEATVYAACSFEETYSVGRTLTKNFKISFTEKLQDLDSLYWDFEYKGRMLTLHYNVFVGLHIFPLSLKEAKDADNESVRELGELLFKYLSKIHN